ncbi:TPA: hypothetical protein I7734_07425 [Vibrio vulnificus]|nr:hypothetical protein [Vibrio vulnificus]
MRYTVLNIEGIKDSVNHGFILNHSLICKWLKKKQKIRCDSLKLVIEMSKLVNLWLEIVKAITDYWFAIL